MILVMWRHPSAPRSWCYGGRRRLLGLTTPGNFTPGWAAGTARTWCASPSPSHDTHPTIDQALSSDAPSRSG